MKTDVKKKVTALRKQDKSIVEIMKITGLPKTTIYQHIKDIPLSPQRILRYRSDCGKHIRQFAMIRKGKSVRAFEPFNTWNSATVLLVAHLMFDGEIHERRGCAYNNRNKILLERVRKCMSRIYTFEPKEYTNPYTGVHRISYYNVALAGYLQTKAKILIQEIEKMPLRLQKEFVRAFFDDEGCMDFRPGRCRIRGYQKNTAILVLIQSLLEKFDIDARLQFPNEVVIVGKENLLKFERDINFSPGVFINGDRTNSIWKKHLEKRQLLRMAIESFKN